MLAPAASAGVGTSPSNHWTFKVSENGVWSAQGDHVSFNWQLKPFEVYNVMVDGTLLFGELSFPVDATSYMTEGATFKVMMGNTKLLQLNDNPEVDLQASCSSPRDPQIPPGPCDIAFPEASTFDVYERGGTTHYHIEVMGSDQTVRPCANVITQGSSSLDGATIMFEGSLNFHAPPGLAMTTLVEG